MSLGYVVADLLCWISDVSRIPEESWERLMTQYINEEKLSIVVIDCLGLQPHLSHYGFRDCLAAAKRFRAPHNYIIGFGHRVPHEDWIQICRHASPHPDRENTTANDCTDPSGYIANGRAILDELGMASSFNVKPSFDGLKLKCTGRVLVEEHDPWS